jgi:hypothetical protein
MYRIDQLGTILRAVSRTGAILIGGQAVNLWSERYQREAEPWQSLRPFTSVDVDLLGNQADARACAEGTGGDLELPDDPSHTPNTAKIHCPEPAIDIDVLHTVNGLNTAEAAQTAVSLKHSDLPLRVLHPVLCLESKTVSLITLDQSVEGRQDEKHLRLSIANCAEFLGELTRQGRDPETLLRWAERLRAHASSQAGLDVQRRYHLDFQQAIPMPLWRETAGPLAKWCREEGPRWRAEIREQIRDIEEIARWVRDLKDRPGGER